jgi:hypothetical protein
MLPDIFALLATPAVQALVGNRIYRHGDAPPDVQAPYITWFVLFGDPENGFSGIVGATTPARARSRSTPWRACLGMR